MNVTENALLDQHGLLECQSLHQNGLLECHSKWASWMSPKMDFSNVIPKGLPVSHSKVSPQMDIFHITHSQWA